MDTAALLTPAATATVVERLVRVATTVGLPADTFKVRWTHFCR